MSDEPSKEPTAEPLYDVHPLDRDYSSDDQPKATSRPIFDTKMHFHPGVRWAGVIIMATGLFSLLSTAFLLNLFRENTSSATLLSIANRFSSIVMLFGGVMIVLAYRLRQLDMLRGFLKGFARYIASFLVRKFGVDPDTLFESLGKSTFYRLLRVSIVGFLVAWVIVLFGGRSSYFYLFLVLIPFLCTGVMVHGSHLRVFFVALAIGFSFITFQAYASRVYPDEFAVLLAVVLGIACLCSGYSEFMGSREAPSSEDDGEGERNTRRARVVRRFESMDDSTVSEIE